MGKSESVNHRTDNTMAKGQSTRGQPMMYKTLLRKQKIEQHLIFFLCNKYTLKGHSETFPVFENKGKYYNSFIFLSRYSRNASCGLNYISVF